MDNTKSNILVADDERLIVNQLEELLDDSGYNVVGAAFSGAEAIAMTSTLKPDLVLMDIVMPGEIDGIDACDTIQRTQGIPVVLISGYSAATYVKRATRVLPYGYVLKPYQDRQITTAIEMALETKLSEQNRFGQESCAPLVAQTLELQLKEIHHRIKNQLNMVNSFIDFQSRHLSDSTGLAVVREIKSRIAAIAHIHQQIYSSKDLDSVNAKEYFAMLEKSLRFSYALPPSIHLELESGPYEINSQKMLLLGLIITEFVSNSLKHAFPGLTCGDIRIDMQKAGAGYILTLSDSGVGLPPGFDFSTLRTFGLQILRGMVEQIKGKFQVVDGMGTTFMIVFEA